MSHEANKEIARRLIEEDLNTGDPAMAEAVVHPHFVDHTNPPGMQEGLDGHQQILKLFRSAFPDVKWTIQEMLADGDKVAMRLVWHGTHTGSFFGIPATGKLVEVQGTHIVRIEDSKVIEHWGNDDDLGLMRQIGALPTPA